MLQNSVPLSERMRPNSLSSFIGQDKLLGKDQILRRSIESGKIHSMIFWGPPGSGKTTLAHIISKELDLPFYTLSAISSGVKDVRAIIQMAQKQQNVIVFIDEIHRFNKSQQDSLLGAVEKGIITLIGATTENPSFEVISPLLSRCRVYILESLEKKELLKIMNNGIKNDALLKKKKINIKENDGLLALSGGDARKLLNLTEIVINAIGGDEVEITNEKVGQFAQEQIALYDKSGEQHYDIISAFIKSIRGSDPNGAIYWLARMIEGGEDPKFIARRMLILASEDIGNANPTALVIASSCFEAVNVIGYPECEIILSHAVSYLAASPKSNAAYKAIKAAKALVKKTGDLPVPLHLRNAPTQLMKDLDYGKDYKYAHNYDENFIDLDYLPEEIKNRKLYDPGKNPREKEIRDRLKLLWKQKYDY